MYVAVLFKMFLLSYFSLVKNNDVNQLKFAKLIFLSAPNFAKFII